MPDFSTALATLRQKLEWLILQRLANVVRFTTYARTTAKGDTDQVEGRPLDPSQPKTSLRVRRMQHFGFRSVPPVGALATVVHSDGAVDQGMAVAEDMPDDGPQDLKAGEAAIWCHKGGTIIKLDKDGNIAITAAAGKDVTVNGGTAKVARVGDTVTTGVWMASSTGAGPVTFTKIGPEGPLPGTPPEQILDLSSGEITEGAEHFKG